MFSIIVGLIVAVILIILNIVLQKVSFPKEGRILAIIVIMTGYIYWGFEPYAHHEMHPHVADATYTFDGKADVEALKEAGADTAETEAFWAKAVEAASLSGNVAAGKELVAANCTGCHSITSEGFPELMSDADAAASYGVTPPDLSIAGKIYDKNFLAAVIMDPVKAMHIEHKYPVGGDKVFPMPASDWMAPQEIADMVAYLASAASKVPAVETKEGASEFEISKAQNKQVFEAACVRCHPMSYAGIEAKTPADIMSAYIGATPPDLSQHIRSRGDHYLHNFINDPQRKLPGTGMPRVGLTQEAEKQVVEYMTQIGDSKKQEREELGPKVLIYLVILAIFALLWKKQIWRDLH
ncbi:c-type cytochrome [bacterium]|nr:c-type cytochrome [bacterium]MBU1989538.1 c-type cytochrome [bacterium]